VSAPAQRWAEIRRIACATILGCPSTARIRSPTCSTPSAGFFGSTRLTEAVEVTVWIEGLRFSNVLAPLRLPENRIAQNKRNAIAMFTPGPARITAIRFHGACV
jgi:hypothetical protein